jgi:hypothetical protein
MANSLLLAFSAAFIISPHSVLVSHWLFTEHMESCIESLNTMSRMKAIGSTNGNDLDIFLICE